MIKYNFAIFILSHGRANTMQTVETIKRCGYTGKWYIIIDNEDEQENDYYKNFKEHIVKFDKIEAAKHSDTIDNFKKRNIVLFARNETFKIANKLGLEYFLVLDDDYNEFRMRYDSNGLFTSIYLLDFDSVVNEMIDFLNCNENILSVAFAQTGDFIGGMGSRIYKERLSRKCMNSFFCKTNRPFKFLGRINEDVNMYCLLGSRGKLLFTIADMSLNQCDTQQNSGGLTESYLDIGTYVKSFYSVICCPSFVKVIEMGCNHRRIHHSVDWEHCTPKIISEKYRKK